MLLPGREWQEGYRFGFQDQEVETEFADGAILFKYRIADPRIGRFFSVDPIAEKYPQLSPYQFADNQVIHANELEGLENSNNLNENGYPIRGPYTYNQLNQMFSAWGSAFLTNPKWTGVSTASQVYFIHQTADGIWHRELVLAGDPSATIYEVIQTAGYKGDDPGYTHVSFEVNKYSQITAVIPFPMNSNTITPAANNAVAPIINFLNANPSASIQVQGNTTLPAGLVLTDARRNPWAVIDGAIVNNGTATSNVLCDSRARAIKETMVAGGVNGTQIQIMPNQYNQPTTSTTVTATSSNPDMNLPVPRSNIVEDTSTPVTPQ